MKIETLIVLATEIIQWQDSGKLPENSSFHAFTKTLTHIPETNRHQVAEAMVNRGCLDYVVAMKVAPQATGEVAP